MAVLGLLRTQGSVVSTLRPGCGEFAVIQHDIRGAPVRQLNLLAALHKAKGLAALVGELSAVVGIGFQIQTALRVQAEHQAVTVNAMRPEHAAGGDLAETGEHLVEKFDEVAHIGCSWGDVKRKAGMKHYSWLGAEIKKPRSAWLSRKSEKSI